MKKIEIENLTFRYKSRDKGQTAPVLKEAAFFAEDGESVGIIGANGAGKSTLLKILVGLLPGYEGSVQVCGMDVVKENLSAIRRKAGYVFQDSDSQLFMNTVYEDVAFAPRNYGMSEEKVKERTLEALRQTGIEELKDRHIYRLSGGQKKLAAIASVLSMGAEILLMDEPSAALDPGNRRKLIHILNELPAVRLIAAHDLDFIYDTCGRTVLLSEGEIVRAGKTEEILKDEELLASHGLELPLSFRFMKGV